MQRDRATLDELVDIAKAHYLTLVEEESTAREQRRCVAVRPNGEPCGQAHHKEVAGFKLCFQHWDSIRRESELDPAGIANFARWSDDRLSGHPAVIEWSRREKARRDEELAQKGSVGFVYFAYREGHIKIGSSADPLRRLRSLALGGVVMPNGVQPGELQLLATERGGQSRERELHVEFAKHRVAGEWFEDCIELRQYIEMNAADAA